MTKKQPHRETCKNAVVHIAANPYAGKPLKKPLDEFHSSRTNDYRIIYTVVEKRITIIVIAVGHRRDIYEKFSRIRR